MKQSARRAIFFVLIFVLFFIGYKGIEFSKGYLPWPIDMVYLLVGAIFTLIIVGIFYLAKMDKTTSTENFWDVSLGAQCRGGPYFWDPESELGKKCLEMASTPAGRCELASYNCPTGFNGLPSLPFEYTPSSDDTWHNERCDKKPNCGCPFDEKSLTSFTKYKQ